jgi:CubicO group peptidase (beta-lactamase class C family)
VQQLDDTDSVRASDLLGALLEELSGLDLETLFRQRVFGPLGMPDT